jgi:outer membrane protein OmpA-like peptidoglycan-associated protein
MKRKLRHCLLVALLYGLTAFVGVSGCSLISVTQDPFPAMDIRADRPAPPPARVVLTASAIQISDKVQFELGKAELLPVSFSLLDEVAAMMKDNPQIELLQVEGHTDSIGSATANKTLSNNRAESVRKYIIAKGIAKARLASKGFGPDKPIADNSTDQGREQNRRVEFNILKQGPKKTMVQDE